MADIMNAWKHDVQSWIRQATLDTCMSAPDQCIRPEACSRPFLVERLVISDPFLIRNGAAAHLVWRSLDPKKGLPLVMSTLKGA